MQNGTSTVAPEDKPSPVGVGNWTPAEEPPNEDSIGIKAKKIYVNDNLSTLDRVIIFLAEFLGTGMLVFLGCMGCVNDMYSTKLIPHLQISFTFGLAIMVAVQCFGHISGSHINPAVTIAAVILGHTPVMHIPLYFAGQLLGGIGGFALLKVISPLGVIDGAANATGVCSPGPLGPGVQAWQGACTEFILTFILVMLCAAVWDCRNTTKHDSLSIRLGLAVAVLAMAGGPYSGANMNPARSFGPALLNDDWDNWWVWWIGPMIGGAVAGVLYRFIFSRENEVMEHTAAEIMHLNDKA